MALEVIQLSDLHITSGEPVLGQDARFALDLVLADIEARGFGPDYLVLTGDLAHEGEPEAYDWLADRLDGRGATVCCLAGNHDADNAFGTHLRREDVLLTDRLDDGPWRFVFLDTNALGREIVEDGAIRDHPDRTHAAEACALLPEDVVRLDDALATAGDSHVMVWMHHPVVAHPLAAVLAEQGDAPQLRARFAESPRVRGVGAGHVHNAFATERDGIRYFTCPSVWVGLDFDTGTIAPPGYRHFRFHDDGSIESTAHLVEHERYAARPPYPDWVPKALGVG